MADKVTKGQRSYTMSRIRSTGTAPEKRLLALLRELLPGYAIIVHPKGLPGTPDALIPELRMAVFADGCFFHGCRKHGHIPEDNHAYWEAKFRRNHIRDLRVNRDIKELGLRPVRIWEHYLGRDIAYARRKLRKVAREQQLIVMVPFRVAEDGPVWVEKGGD